MYVVLAQFWQAHPIFIPPFPLKASHRADAGLLPTGQRKRLGATRSTWGRTAATATPSVAPAGTHHKATTRSMRTPHPPQNLRSAPTRPEMGASWGASHPAGVPHPPYTAGGGPAVGTGDGVLEARGADRQPRRPRGRADGGGGAQPQHTARDRSPFRRRGDNPNIVDTFSNLPAPPPGALSPQRLDQLAQQRRQLEAKVAREAYDAALPTTLRGVRGAPVPVPPAVHAANFRAGVAPRSSTPIPKDGGRQYLQSYGREPVWSPNPMEEPSALHSTAPPPHQQQQQQQQQQPPLREPLPYGGGPTPGPRPGPTPHTAQVGGVPMPGPSPPPVTGDTRRAPATSVPQAPWQGHNAYVTTPGGYHAANARESRPLPPPDGGFTATAGTAASGHPGWGATGHSGGTHGGANVWARQPTSRGHNDNRTRTFPDREINGYGQSMYEDTNAGHTRRMSFDRHNMTGVVWTPFDNLYGYVFPAKAAPAQAPLPHVCMAFVWQCRLCFRRRC